MPQNNSSLENRNPEATRVEAGRDPEIAELANEIAEAVEGFEASLVTGPENIREYDIAEGKVEVADRSVDSDSPEAQAENMATRRRLGPNARPLKMVSYEPGTDRGIDKSNHPRVYLQSISRGGETYSQRVSDELRRQGLQYFSAERVPINPDGCVLEVAAAKVIADRIESIDQEHDEANGSRQEFEIAEVGAEHAKRTEGILFALKLHHPDIYSRVSARVIAINETDAQAINDSGIFEKFGDGKVTVVAEGPEGPELSREKETVFALCSDASMAPAHRLINAERNDDGDLSKVLEVGMMTFTDQQKPLNTAEVSPTGLPSPVGVDVSKFYGQLDTASLPGPGARDRYAPNITVKQAFLLAGDGGIRLSEDVEMRDEDVANFMQGWPCLQNEVEEGEKPSILPRHYAPELEARLAQITRQVGIKGLVVAEGRVRDGDNAYPLTITAGIVNNLIEADTGRNAAVSAGLDRNAVLLPQDPEVEYSPFFVIDKAARFDDNLPRQAIETFDEYLGEANPGERFLESITKIMRMDRTRMAEARILLDDSDRFASEEAQAFDRYATAEAVSAKHVVARYQRLLSKYPQLSLDSDLALGLATLLNEHGHYAAAIEIADKAIAAAPHVNAGAHVEKAKALMWMGELEAGSDDSFQKAQAALDAARAISPRYNDQYLVQADLCLRREDFDGYALALAELQNCAPLREPELPNAKIKGLPPEDQEKFIEAFKSNWEEKQVINAWKAIAWGKVEASLRPFEGGAQDTIVVETWPKAADGLVWRPRIEQVDSRQAEEIRKLLAVQSVGEIAVGLYSRLEETAKDRNAQREAVLGEILAYGNAVLSPARCIELLEQYQDSRFYIGETALKILEFERNHPPHSTTIEVPREKPTLVELGEFDHIELGRILQIMDMENYDGRAPFILNALDFNDHVAIIGISGSGKTTLVKEIIKKLNAAGFPITIIDCARDQYTDMQGVYGFIPGSEEGLKVFSLGLLMPEPGFSHETHMDYVRQIMLFTNEPEPPFPQLISTALKDGMHARGYKVENTKFEKPLDVATVEPMSMQDFYNQLVKSSLGYTGDVKQNVGRFLEVRAQQICTGSLGRVLGSDYPVDFDAHKNGIDLLSLHNIGDDDDKIMIAAAWLLREYERASLMRKANEGDLTLRKIIVISEAHHILKRASNGDKAAEKAAQFFSNMIRQLRGLGIGVIFETQEPEEINESFPRNASCEVVLKVKDNKAKEVVLHPMGITSEDKLWGMVGEFPKGQCIVLRSNAGGGAFVAQVRKPDEPEEKKGLLLDPPLLNIHGRHEALSESGMAHEEEVAAKTALAGEQHTPLVAMATLVALANVSNSPLPSVLPQVQKWYDHATPRERAILLTEVAKHVVVPRGPAMWKTTASAKMVATVQRDLQRMLEGVQLAGTTPARSFMVPQLAGALTLFNLTKPSFGGTPAQPRAAVLDPHGFVAKYRESLGEKEKALLPVPQYNITRVSHILKALERHPETTLNQKNSKSAAANQQATKTALLGSDNGGVLMNLMERMSGRDPNYLNRILALADKSGLHLEGSPNPGWLASMILMLKHF